MRKLLEIRLQLSLLGNDTLKTRVVDSPEGEITESQPFSFEQLSKMLWAGGPEADPFMRDPYQLAEAGQVLFRSLGRVGRWLSSFRSFTASQEQMRLYVHFDDPKLALPWEIIHDGRHFLCLGTDLSVIRVWGGLAPPLRLRPVDRLSILSFLSSPNNMPPTLFELGPKIVEEALAFPLQQGQVQLTSIHAGGVDQFRARLAEGIHLVHFFGYQQSTGDRPSLVFADAEGAAETVNDTQLEDGLRSLGDLIPRAIILADQELAGTAYATSAGLARAINAAGVPVVVALQGSLDEKAFRTFTRTLYQAMADQLDLDQALAHARVAINSESGGRNGTWAVPVLYSSGPLPDSLLAFKDAGYSQLYSKSWESSQIYQGTGRGAESAPPSSGMQATDAYNYGRRLREAIQSDPGLSSAERITLRVLVEKLEDALAAGTDVAFIQSMLDELSVYSTQAANVAEEMRRKLIA